MYNTVKIPVTPSLASVPVKLPLHILLAMPEYDNHFDILRFNLPAAIFTILNKDWKQVTKVMIPSIWAPDWNEERLRTFIMTPFDSFQISSEQIRSESLRARYFPGSGSLRNPHRGNYPHYEIIHFIGRVTSQTDGPGLDLGSKEKVLLTEPVREALVAAQTRLLILQVPSQNSSAAEQLARIIVGNGGPVVLVVDSSDASILEVYLLDVYANILHNRSLPNLVRPESRMDDSLNVRVFYSEGEENVFQFKDWISTLNDQLERSQRTARVRGENFRSLRVHANRHLHHAQAAPLGVHLHIEATKAQRLEEMSTNLLSRRLNGREGLLSLSEYARTSERTVGRAKSLEVRHSELHREYQRKAAQAPRVLNTNFADLQGRMVEPKEGLVAEREYDLLVDVGPRWKNHESIVTGHANFPIDAFPPDEDDYVVQVVVVSEDFSPNMISAEMLVPRRTGPSFPIEKGNRAEQSGPVALRLRAPGFPSGSNVSIITARARLCLYYKNNLLQSAIVRVGVVGTEGIRLEEDNTVEVDYVLTTSFQEVKERLAGRAVNFTSTDDTANHPVRLNLTLNDDRANGHRIIITHQLESDAAPASSQGACPPRGWTPYNPIAAADILKRSRDRLQAVCFHKSLDNKGNIRQDQNNQPFGQQNDKTLDQFKLDLFLLAKIGSDLHNSAFSQVRFEGANCKQNMWVKALEQTLATPSVIQIARTASVPAQYVFPWALLYSIPLPDKDDFSKLSFCNIVHEEWSTGIRSAPASTEEEKQRLTCPYQNEDWHSKNIICPYGFWGLKHIIEQPTSVLSQQNGNETLPEAAKEILTGMQPSLSISVTRDTNLNTDSINQHLSSLGQFMHITPSEVAIDWPGVQTMLMAPEVVYFLCHNLYDAAENISYLSIGPNDNQPVHMISSTKLAEWERLTKPPGPNDEEWAKRHPFIFINGCHTADLEPARTLDFVTTFSNVGASGVLGTEVSVLLPVAIEVAQALFEKLTQTQGTSIGLGQALYEIRWQLANKGNLLGLAYTLYSLADLHIVRENQ